MRPPLGGVEIRSILYNASYRKPNKKSEIRRYELLEAQPIEASVDLAETLSDYGVIFCIDGQHLKVSLKTKNPFLRFFSFSALLLELCVLFN